MANRLQERRLALGLTQPQVSARLKEVEARADVGMVSRYEKDPERLKAIYELGREDCRRKLPEIRAILARDAQEGGA